MLTGNKFLYLTGLHYSVVELTACLLQPSLQTPFQSVPVAPTSSSFSFANFGQAYPSMFDEFFFYLFLLCITSFFFFLTFQPLLVALVAFQISSIKASLDSRMFLFFYCSFFSSDYDFVIVVFSF